MTHSRALKALERQSREWRKVFQNKIKRIPKIFPKLSKQRAVLESCDVAVKRRRSEESGRKIRSDVLAEKEIKVVEDFFNGDDK